MKILYIIIHRKNVIKIVRKLLNKRAKKGLDFYIIPETNTSPKIDA